MNNDNLIRVSVWKKTPFIVLIAFICCSLWGSAFPSIKIGYSLFSIDSWDSRAQILFAGMRFSLSGVMVILSGSFIEKKIIRPRLKSLPQILLLSLFQTVGQYFFFYLGLARTSGVNASIIEASNTFFTILWACLIFRTERIGGAKIAGCVLGFAGVCLVELHGNGSIDLNLSLFGDGFILASCLLASFVPSLLKLYAGLESPFVLSGYQFLLGGIIMMISSFAFGARIDVLSGGIGGFSLLSYMAFISACAYTLWTLLMQSNDVSKIAIFGFINPIIGFLLSAALLGEVSQAFSAAGIVSLLLVSAGIFLVYFKKPEKAQ